MVAHDVLDDARHAHAPSTKNADDTIKTVSHLGTDEDRLAVVDPWNLEEGLLILLQCRLALLGGERFMTDKELCAKLQLSRRTLQDYRNNGVIPYVQLGGKILYRESDIQKILMANYREAYRMKGV